MLVAFSLTPHAHRPSGSVTEAVAAVIERVGRALDSLDGQSR